MSITSPTTLLWPWLLGCLHCGRLGGWVDRTLQEMIHMQLSTIVCMLCSLFRSTAAPQSSLYFRPPFRSPHSPLFSFLHNHADEEEVGPPPSLLLFGLFVCSSSLNGPARPNIARRSPWVRGGRGDVPPRGHAVDGLASIGVGLIGSSPGLSARQSIHSLCSGRKQNRVCIST